MLPPGSPLGIILVQHLILDVKTESQASPIQSDLNT